MEEQKVGCLCGGWGWYYGIPGPEDPPEIHEEAAKGDGTAQIVCDCDTGFDEAYFREG